MKIWAFDPGSVATGIAWVYQHAESFEAFQMDSDTDIWEAIHNVDHGRDDIFLIEMYRTAGHLTKHAQNTIEMIGSLKTTIRLLLVEPLLVTEQARLSGQREAAELMEDDMDILRKDPLRKDAFSALSHCCAYRRRLNG